MRMFNLAAMVLVAGLSCLPVSAQNAPPDGPGAGGPPPRGEGGPRRGGEGAPPRGPRGQGGGMMGRQLSPEKAKAAWEAEAKWVTRDFGLDEAKSKAVIASYTSAREEQQAGVQKLMEHMRDARQGDNGGGDAPGAGTGAGAGAGGAGAAGGEGAGGPGGRFGQMQQEMQQKIAELNKTQREKLAADLGHSLSSDQVDKAMPLLGAFNPGWDSMIDAITGFKLDEAKNAAAFDAVQTYTLAVEQARANAKPDDREATRNAVTENRKALMASLKNVLSEEQLKQFDNATSMGGGRGARGGRGGGEGGGERGGPGGGRRGRGGDPGGDGDL